MPMPAAAEDAGYLVTFVTTPDKSQLVVYNASTMDSTPTASVKLPCRVPAGFHGLHLNEAQMASQLCNPGPL